MLSTYMDMKDIIDNEDSCPFPIAIIRNNMGINLCSVDGISWQKQEDGQLINLTIHFRPGQTKESKDV